MPIQLVSASAFICEKILQEIDGVPTAIRIADIFTLPEYAPKVPTALQVVDFTLMVIIKVLGVSPTEKHTVLVTMTRPDGQESQIFVNQNVTFSQFEGHPEIPSGASLGMRVNVSGEVMGVHYFEVFLAGKSIAKVAFTLLEPEQSQTGS
jgi:hypothetical protein